MKATVFPSGLKRGKLSWPGGEANGSAVPPVFDTIHKSFAYEKMMCVALTSG
jgi:hypothetical protein